MRADDVTKATHRASDRGRRGSKAALCDRGKHLKTKRLQRKCSVSCYTVRARAVRAGEQQGRKELVTTRSAVRCLARERAQVWLSAWCVVPFGGGGPLRPHCSSVLSCVSHSPGPECVLCPRCASFLPIEKKECRHWTLHLVSLLVSSQNYVLKLRHSIVTWEMETRRTDFSAGLSSACRGTDNCASTDYSVLRCCTGSLCVSIRGSVPCARSFMRRKMRQQLTVGVRDGFTHGTHGQAPELMEGTNIPRSNLSGGG